ncbi:hypothetical protein MEJ65_00175 [Candidatus Carsonella ruddii]|uniref:Haloacid dehalogenase-like hydrolase n=2 Tax=Carsonella ruddii TaxID=114186 RepID=A0AAJ6JXR3_CARRU|nr:hypothetical protein [Candidatus Carsonella ruddii]WGS67282.1 hypothetical protein MEJ65_00175 [Candidatus Carsonella ruddii]WMC18298.1 MAG: hypothetical protein NU472_00175 [Candidatus Carsonella ruddii]WMC18492.1 MAG: hypothetical protein NU470_00175 [Candidatus Carsonella ruddii]
MFKIKFINMFKFLFDYDNTILNCDSDFLWGKIIEKINIFKKKNINNIFYVLYEKRKINNYCYFFYLKKFFLNIKKIKIIFNYVLKIFQNNNYFLFKLFSISTSTNFFLIENKKKILNKYFLCTNFKIININYKKNLNILNINCKKKIFISDSINDLYFYFFNKKNIIYNPDKYFYLFKYNKIFNKKNY